MARIKKGDLVYVIAGKDKGKKGKVQEVAPSRNRAVVEGVNLVKKHLRRSQDNPQGAIIERPAFMHLSNLMLFCPKCNRPARVGKKILDNGKKERRCKRCEEMI